MQHIRNSQSWSSKKELSKTVSKHGKLKKVLNVKERKFLKRAHC